MGINFFRGTPGWEALPSLSTRGALRTETEEGGWVLMGENTRGYEEGEAWESQHLA